MARYNGLTPWIQTLMTLEGMTTDTSQEGPITIGAVTKFGPLKSQVSHHLKGKKKHFWLFPNLETRPIVPVDLSSRQQARHGERCCGLGASKKTLFRCRHLVACWGYCLFWWLKHVKTNWTAFLVPMRKWWFRCYWPSMGPPSPHGDSGWGCLTPPIQFNDQ